MLMVGYMADIKKQPTLIGEFQHIKALVEETAVSLQSQRDILKMRGLKLPPRTLSAINSLASDITRLESNIMSDQTELGQLRSLADTSAMINSSLDPNIVLEGAMDVIITLTGAERGYIILVGDYSAQSRLTIFGRKTYRNRNSKFLKMR